MQAGRLLHSMTIQKPTRVTGADGKTVLTWVDVIDTFVAFASSTGREFVNAREVVANATHVLRARWSAEFATDRRLNWTARARIFNIASVEDIGERSRDARLTVVEDVTRK